MPSSPKNKNPHGRKPSDQKVVASITITDTLGNIIVYQNDHVTGTGLKENNTSYNVKWSLLLNGAVVSQYYNYIWTSGNDRTLSLVKNGEGEYTNYYYNRYISSTGNGQPFNSFISNYDSYYNDSVTGYADQIILYQVTYPNQQIVEYSSNVSGYAYRRLGFAGYERYHALSYHNRDDGSNTLNDSKSYTYGDYTHLNTPLGEDGDFKYSTEVSLKRSKTFSGVSYTWPEQVMKCEFNQTQLKQSETVYCFNVKQDDLITESNVFENLGSQTLNKRTTYIYNSNDLPTAVNTTLYDTSGNAGMTVNYAYTYDSAGNVLTETAPNGQTKTYTYDANYSIPTSVQYLQDANTTIRMENTLTTNGKAIEKTVIKENGVDQSRTDYVYDSSGRVVNEKQYIDTANYIEKQYAYGSYANSTEVKTLGVKDAEGNLVAGTPGYPDGTIVTTMAYDDRERPIIQTDANGNSTTLEYDNLDRITRVTHPDDTYATYSYNVPQNEVIYTDERGYAQKYIYNRFGNQLSIIDLTTNETLSSRRYNSRNQMIEEIVYSSEGDDLKTYYYYDVKQRLIEKGTLNGSGTVTSKETYVYQDWIGKTTKTIFGDADAPSIVSTQTATNMGWVTSQARILNGTEYTDTFTYDYVGNKLQEKTAIAYAEYSSVPYTTQWEYNYAGKAVKTTNVYGDFSTSQYDWLGRLTALADFQSNATTAPYYSNFEYDTLGRLVSQSVPFEQNGTTLYYAVSQYGYDANGNVTSKEVLSNLPEESDAFSETTYEYDSRNNLIKAEIDGSYTEYEYDALGNQISMISSESAQTTYEYDHLNRMTGLTDPMGQSESYTYDLNGSVLTKTDRNGNTTTYSYDDLGRVFSTVVRDSDNTVLDSQTVSYTLTGQVRIEQNGSVTLTRTYDALGRMVTESETGGIVKSYAYNLADLRVSYTLTKSGSTVMSTTYTYDHLNRLATVSENGTQVAAYTYDVNGNRATLTNGNGTSVEYAYNLANLVTSLTNKMGTETLSSYSYAYYLDGNQAAKTDHTGRTTAYTYDGAGRLTEEAESGAADAVTKAYTFDARGNRVTMTVSGAESYTTSYAYDLNNRLLTETKDDGTDQTVTEYFYDPNGNTVAKNTAVLSESSDPESITVTADGGGVELYTYDGFNRLTLVENDTGLHTYDYRPDGLRMSKTTGGVTVTHIWDGQNITVELDANGNVIDRYIRGVGLIASDNHGYYLYNAHGDVVQLTNSTGAVTKEYHYDAFGNEKTPDAEDTNSFRYCGEYYDLETKTYYLRARNYDPTTGRFLNEDTMRAKLMNIYNPYELYQGIQLNGGVYADWTKQQYIINDPLSLNLYTYCYNNPIRFVDPTGHETQIGDPPPESSGYVPPKGGPKTGKDSKGNKGWVDKNSNIWVPDSAGHGIDRETGDTDHWDVQRPDGKGYINVGKSGKQWGGSGKQPNLPSPAKTSTINWGAIGAGVVVVVIVVVAVAAAPETGGASLGLLVFA